MHNIQSDLTTLTQYLHPNVNFKPTTKKEALVALKKISAALENTGFSIDERNEILEKIKPFCHIDLSEGFKSTISKISRLSSRFLLGSQRIAISCVEKIEEKNRIDIEKTSHYIHEDKKAIREQYSPLVKEVLQGRKSSFSLKGLILEMRERHPRHMITVQEELALVKELFQEKINSLEHEGLSAQPLKRSLWIFQKTSFLSRPLSRK